MGGETWAALSDRLDSMIGPLGEAAMAALAPLAGERVVDIGCGCGQTTLAPGQMRVAAPGGSALGVDISAQMLATWPTRIAAARRRPGQLSAAFLRGRRPGPRRFELGERGRGVLALWGDVLRGSRRSAFANIRRAPCSPGGRLAFLCWRAMTENPMMTIAFTAALPHLPQAPPPPRSPGAGPVRLRRLRGPGARDPGRRRLRSDILAIAAHDQPITSGGLAETVDTALRVGPLGTIVRENPSLEGVVVGAVRDAFATYATARAEPVYLNAATWIVTARKG